EVAERFQMRSRLLYANRPRRVAVFVSRYDHCLYDLLLRRRAGEIAGDIALVVSNHPDLAPVAAQFGVDYVCMPKDAANRDDVERRELALLDERKINLVVLARYMQILGPAFVDRFDGRIINIHHSFLPAFVGQKPYHQAYQRGVKLVGATAH